MTHPCLTTVFHVHRSRPSMTKHTYVVFYTDIACYCYPSVGAGLYFALPNRNHEQIREALPATQVYRFLSLAATWTVATATFTAIPVKPPLLPSPLYVTSSTLSTNVKDHKRKSGEESWEKAMDPVW